MIHKLIVIDNSQVLLNSKLITPQASLKLINHSPDGFSWGYEGSGCAQLALAILQSLHGTEYALKHYQQFKRDVIAKIQNGPRQVEFQIVQEYQEPKFYIGT